MLDGGEDMQTVAAHNRANFASAFALLVFNSKIRRRLPNSLNA